MNKVLITGGAGFIGFHLAKKLLKSDCQVDLIDNFSRGVNDKELSDLSKDKNLNLINIDLLNSANISSLDSDYNFIYHLAAVIGVQHVLKAPYDVLTKNFILLDNAIAIAKKQNNLKKIIFASTSEVYAGTLFHYGLTFPTKETTPLSITDLSEARSSYMLSKIYGEATCIHSGLPVTIIRPHNFYGPRMGLSHVIPELMKKIININNGNLDVYSVEHKRTFCFITDAVEMIQKLAESNLTTGKAYNVGNQDEEISMGDLARKIIILLDKKIKINSMPPTAGSPERRCPSIDKLNNVISFNKKFPLDKGLEKTFIWYNENIFSGEGISAI